MNTNKTYRFQDYRTTLNDTKNTKARNALVAMGADAEMRCIGVRGQSCEMECRGHYIWLFADELEENLTAAEVLRAAVVATIRQIDDGAGPAGAPAVNEATLCGYIRMSTNGHMVVTERGRAVIGA